MSTFIAEAQIEARASELWRAHGLAPGFDIELLLDRLGLDLCWQEVDDGGEAGTLLGMLLPGRAMVVVNERHQERLEERDGRQLRFTIGHEIGHWILHAKGLGPGSSPLFDGERIMCRDGSGEWIERQAESFAAAVLIGREALRAAMPREDWRGWGPLDELADRFAVSRTAMRIRLERLEWIHLRDGMPVSGAEPAKGQGSLLR